MFVVQSGRKFDVVSEYHIAHLSVLAYAALSTQSHLRAVLRFGWHLQSYLAALRLNHDLTTQESGIEIDTHVGIERQVDGLSLMSEPTRVEVAATEEVLEEGREISTGELAEIETIITASATELACLLPMFPILIISLPLFRVRQHLVGLIQGLEFSLRLRVIRMQIGMKFARPLAVGLFHLFLGIVLGHPHNFVVINECHNLCFFIFNHNIARIVPNKKRRALSDIFSVILAFNARQKGMTASSVMFTPHDKSPAKFVPSPIISYFCRIENEKNMIKIAICGGGSLGHVCAGVLASQSDVTVHLYTRHPERWSDTLRVTDPSGKVYEGPLAVVSNDPAEALAGCDLIFLCLPGYAIASTLTAIRPHIGHAVVGSIVCSTGFFFDAHRILAADTPLFGFQRVPFIARMADYGSSAHLLGYKPQVAIATEHIADTEAFRQLVERLWLTPCRLLGSHYDVSLTNSNPILHTGRLYTMWKDWQGEVYDRNFLFYKEWTDEASQCLIDMDAEFMQLLQVLPVTPGAIPSLLDYYESHDAASITRKISSIPAFAPILSPMKEVEGGWIPDFSSRYFTEDFPYGLHYIWQLAKEKGIATPTIDKVYAWGIARMEKG